MRIRQPLPRVYVGGDVEKVHGSVRNTGVKITFPEQREIIRVIDPPAVDYRRDVEEVDPGADLGATALTVRLFSAGAETLSPRSAVGPSEAPKRLKVHFLQLDRL